MLGFKKDLVGFAFVDDTDLCMSGNNHPEGNPAPLLQKSIANWEGLLCMIGRPWSLTNVFGNLMTNLGIMVNGNKKAADVQAMVSVVVDNKG